MCESTERTETSFVSDLVLHDSDGAVLAQVNGLSARAIDTETNAARQERKFYQMAWERAPAAAASDGTS